MQYLKKIIIGCALAVATILTPVAPASALPMTQDIKIERSSDVQIVRHRGWRHDRYYGRRHWNRRHYRPGFSVYIAPRAVYRDRYIRRAGYNRHVNWCLSRYQSYNPGTNRFLSYGGVYKVCRSPYR